MMMRLEAIFLLPFVISSYVVAGGGITHLTGTGEAREADTILQVDDPQKPSEPTYAPDTFNQQDCIDGVCYASEHQENILRNELYKSHHKCQDLRSWCKDRANECSDSGYIRSYCPQTCRVCHNGTSNDFESESSGNSNSSQNESSPTTEHQQYTHQGQQPVTNNNNQQNRELPRRPKHEELSSKETWGRRIVDGIGSDLGVPQVVMGAPASEIRKAVQEARDYVRNTVMVDDQYISVRNKCINKDERCAMWAAQGKCEDKEFYNLHMWVVCAPMCWTCEQLHYLARCPVDQNTKHAWYPGDLNAMFLRIVNNPDYQRDYKVTVLSRPDYVDGDDEETADYQLGPWLVVLENFVKPEEANKLIEAGDIEGYERSEDSGEEDEEGNVGGDVNSGRTSMNAWCSVEECESEPLVENIVLRMENLTGIPRDYSEHMQLLRYETGQFYQSHHDYNEIEIMRCTGVRILTFFLYLNDVEEGGETDFPELGLAVKPKRGRAVLWPSVLDEDPHNKDDSTQHQALPVLKGVKYGANAWFHQRHFRACLDSGC